MQSAAADGVLGRLSKLTLESALADGTLLRGRKSELSSSLPAATFTSSASKNRNRRSNHSPTKYWPETGFAAEAARSSPVDSNIDEASPRTTVETTTVPDEEGESHTGDFTGDPWQKMAVMGSTGWSRRNWFKC